MIKKFLKRLSLIILIITLAIGLIAANLSFFVQRTPWLIASWSKLESIMLGKLMALPKPLPTSSRIEQVVLDSQLLGEARTLQVYLPAEYDKTANKRYPVIVLLHGSPGDQNDWIKNADLQSQLDELINAKIIVPMIVVMPDGNGPTIIDSEYVDATKLDQPMESHLTKEIVPFIDAHYLTLADRRFRALGGLSSGAYGAVNIGLRNLNLFSIMISHSGYFQNYEWAINELLGKNTNAWHENNPADYIDSLNIPPDTSIYLEVAKVDYPSFIKGSQSFASQLAKRHIEHFYTESDGVHSWSNWRTAIRQSLTYTSSKWLQWGLQTSI